MSGRKCVVLMAYGSPENAHDIDRYLQDIFRTSMIPPEVRAENYKKYSLFGNRSPSSEILHSLRDKLNKSFSSSDVDVFLAFKHWFPKLEEIAQKVREENYSVVVGLPLFPFRSEGVFNSYAGPFMKALGPATGATRVEIINGFSKQPGFADLWKSRLEAMQLNGETETLLYTAHSLPTSKNNEDSYKSDFLALADRLMHEFPGIKGLTGFQSAGKHGGSWLTPPIEKQILDSRPTGTVTLVPLGFVNDHLEVLYDLDIEFSLFLSQQNISYRRAQLPNDSEDFAQFLHYILSEKFSV